MLRVHIDDIEGFLLLDEDVGSAVMGEDDVGLLLSQSHRSDVPLIQTV